MELKHLDDKSFKDFIDQKELTIVDFFATWCPPCKMLAPIVEELAQEAEGYQIAKIDIDQAIDIANEYGVMSIPTIIFYKDGQEIQRLVGFRNKDELLDEINELK